MSTPMVRVLHAKCPECGRIASNVYRDPITLYKFPFEVSAEWVRGRVGYCSRPDFARLYGTEPGCGQKIQWLFATEPV